MLLDDGAADRQTYDQRTIDIGKQQRNAWHATSP
jgi:hypothetical protein